MTKEQAEKLVIQAKPYLGRTIPSHRLGFKTEEELTFSSISNLVGTAEPDSPMNFSVIGILTDLSGGTKESSLMKIISYFESIA